MDKKTDNKTSEVETVQLKDEKIKETSLLPGKLKLVDEEAFYVDLERGELKEVLVKKGDAVEVGTPLLKYENAELSLEQQQQSLQKEILDLTEKKLNNQLNEVNKALREMPDEPELKEQADSLQMEIKQAEIERKQHNLQAESLNKQVADLSVKSQISGKVIEVNEAAKSGVGKAGEEPFIRVGSLNKLVVEGDLTEYDTMKVKPGQKVKITSDAAPKKKWAGEVEYVAELPQADAEDNVSYPVTIKISDKIDLKPGFSMLVEIETKSIEVPTLPLKAVLQEDDEEYVFVVREGVLERVDVEIGSVSKKHIEIKSGLDKKDLVVKEPSESYKEGMSVTVND